MHSHCSLIMPEVARHAITISSDNCQSMGTMAKRERESSRDGGIGFVCSEKLFQGTQDNQMTDRTDGWKEKVLISSSECVTICFFLFCPLIIPQTTHL